MNFSEQFTQVLDTTGQKLGVAIDWTSQNVMPQIMTIMSRYRNFEIVKTSFGILIISIILAIVGWIVSRMIKDYKITRNTKQDTMFFDSYVGSIEPTVPCIVLMIFIFVATIILSSYLGHLIMQLLKWIIIPEVQYIDAVKGLMS